MNLIINNLKNKIISGTILTLLVLSVQLSADNTAVGVVDLRIIMREAPQIDDSNNQLNIKFLPRQKALEEELREIEKLEKLRDADNISGKELTQLERDIRRRKIEHRRALEDFREELRFERDSALTKAQVEIHKAIDLVRQRLGFDIIIQQPISSNAKVNITRQVLDYLNEQMKHSSTNKNNFPVENNNDSHSNPQ